MFLLKRKISAYTGPDLCLGIFAHRSAAESARAQYLAQIAVFDPWREQAYCDTEPAAQVEIDEIDRRGIDDQGGAAGEGFLVSAYYEAFGQILRRFVAIYASRSSAEVHAERLETEEAETEMAPNWCEVDAIALDTLLQVPRA
jgi:hypothetical protein